MPITTAASGTVTTSDIERLEILRAGGGDLRANVFFKYVNSEGNEVKTKATWVLSVPEKTAIVDELLPGAKQAIADAMGL